MRYWLTGVTTNYEGDNLKALIEPVKHLFNGLIWTFHDPQEDDDGWNYLLNNAGEGVIIPSTWSRRLDFSRNKTLFEGGMKEGDWFLVIDDKERIAPEYVEYLKRLSQEESWSGYAHEGKRLFYRYNEGIFYRGNPHEGLVTEGVVQNIENANIPEGWFLNVRGEQRDEYEWVDHYMKYYFFPKTNHLLLGYETNVDYVKIRYNNREKLKNFMLDNGFDFSYDGFQEMWEKYYDTPLVKELINAEKILNDWYRYTILGERKGLIDRHDPKLIKKI